jgi:hypothetical protein
MAIERVGGGKPVEGLLEFPGWREPFQKRGLVHSLRASMFFTSAI